MHADISALRESIDKLDKNNIGSDAKSVLAKLDALQDAIGASSSKSNNMDVAAVNDKLTSVVSDKISIATKSLVEELNNAKTSLKHTIKSSAQPVSNSLDKIIEYLANTVDVQNKADKSIHAKIDQLQAALTNFNGGGKFKQNDAVNDKLARVELQLVGLTRQMNANAMSGNSVADASESAKKDIS